MPAGPSPLWNFGMLAVMVVLFYVLLIMPQQKRFKEHRKMLEALKKGDNVVTGGGLVGKIDKIVGDDELVIDLGSGVKVTALRSTITGKPGEDSPVLKDSKKEAANDKDEAPKEKAPTKKAAAKKTSTKKTTAKKTAKK